jgi:hypothetical protein
MFVNAETGLAHDDGAHVLNGQASGAVGDMIAGARYEPGLLRPYIEDRPNHPLRGKPCVALNGRPKYNNQTGQYVPTVVNRTIRSLQEQGVNSPVFNATLLPRDAWIQMDTAIARVTRQPMRAWADLAASSTLGGFNGMGRLTLEYQTVSDAGEAIVDMDALSEGRGDAPLFDVRSIPLPITHSDFWFSERQLAVSRNGGMPLDTFMAECAGRRIGESLEKTTLGVETGMTYGTRTTGPNPHTGTSTVYGYTNHPARITKTDLATPTGSNASATIDDVIEMRESMYDANFRGPFVLYHTPDWDRWFDQDYILTGGNVATQTLRARIRAIEGISAVRRVDYLTGTYTLLLVQLDGSVARAVVGLDLTTVQWESQGGMRKNFKVMTISVPQIRYDYNGVAGIVHATTS